MEDAVEVTDQGPIFGREAIEKHYADLLQKVHFSNHVLTDDQDSPHIIGTAGKEVWETGGWSCTIQGQNFGPKQIKGYRSVIREGDDFEDPDADLEHNPSTGRYTVPDDNPEQQIVS